MVRNISLKNAWVLAIVFSAIGFLLFLGVGSKESAESVEIVYDNNFNGLLLEVGKAWLEEDEDSGKIVANIPIYLTNNSDHAFLFFAPHFSYNENKDVSTIFYLDNGGLTGKIKRDTAKEGVIRVTLDTRDLESVKTLHPTFKMSDMKMDKDKDKDKDVTPTIHVK
ncbi:hypothetical protein P4597_18910 [Peribacillus simplex]|uniref:hypothetical protein n=1 Tax=Peribacillus simplex TaxID=1478 RepID=UPI002E1BA037|nr:hypothetical protein [Peribacillus simplex]